MTQGGKSPGGFSGFSPSKAERIERCLREIESCRVAQADANLTIAERLGALQGEVDWLVELQMADEE